MLGYGEQELLGRRISEITHADDRERTVRASGDRNRRRSGKQESARNRAGCDKHVNSHWKRRTQTDKDRL